MEQITNEEKAVQFANLKHSRSSYAWNVAHESYLAALLELPQLLNEHDVGGSLQSAAMNLSNEAWRMLPDACKDLMGEDLEKTYKESLNEDIQHSILELRLPYSEDEFNHVADFIKSNCQNFSNKEMWNEWNAPA